jgi:predicted hydrolase (HD superfamily)
MVATAMEAYAQQLDGDPELWYQAGLLHDLDWEQYPDEHPAKAVSEILPQHGYPQVLLNAVEAHAPHRTDRQPQSLMEKYLFAIDELSGLMHAYALMRPQGFEGMKAKKVVKKLQDKAFASGVNRDDVNQGFELIGKEPQDHITFLIQVYQDVGTVEDTAE